MKDSEAVIVYIDGENFVHRALDIFGTEQTSREQLLELDLRQFITRLDPSLESSNIRYYTTRVRFAGAPKKAHSKLQQVVDFNAKWLSRLGNQGIEIIRAGILRARETKPCPKCGAVLNYFVEKGVDVRLAVDIVRDAHNDKVDKMYVVSSDLDLLPAIQLAKSFKKKVTYVTSSQAVIGAMSAATSETLTFTKQDLLDARKK